MEQGYSYMHVKTSQIHKYKDEALMFAFIESKREIE